MRSALTHAQVTHGINGDDEALVHINVKGVTRPPYTSSFAYSNGVVSWLENVLGLREVALPKKVQRFLAKAPRGYVCILSDEWPGYAESILTNGGAAAFEWHDHKDNT